MPTATNVDTPAPTGAVPTRPRTVDRPGQPCDPRFAEYRSTGDRGVRNALIEDHRWLGTHCARRFARRGEPIDDLEQVAMVGLVKAVDRFDPAYGYSFATYAAPTIVGEIRRHFRDHTWATRVPRRAKENYLTVKTTAEELQQILGRSPTIPELADRASLTTEETLEALEAGDSYRGVPLDQPDDHHDQRTDAARLLGGDDPGYDAAEARTILPGLLAELPTTRDRHIIELRFFDNLSQSQIAARLGISQVHVSRLIRASLAVMRRKVLDASPSRSHGTER